MAGIQDRMENPTLGYVVIAVALTAGMLAASAVGQPPGRPPEALDEVETRVDANSISEMLRRKWVLGVRADATDTGYLVRNVEHSSAAQRHGLEVGDRIVAINGTQIGQIGKDVIRLGDQLEREGERNGRVLLLIQDRRNNRLVPVQVTLRHPTRQLGH